MNPPSDDVWSLAPVFRRLHPDLLAALQKSAVERRWKSGAVVTRAGFVSDSLWLLIDGEITVAWDDHVPPREVAHTETHGALFGHGPVLDEVETHSRMVSRDATLLCWSGETLQSLFAEHGYLRTELSTRLSLGLIAHEVMSLLQNADLFRSTSPAIVRRCLDGATLVPFPEGSVVVRQGDQGDTFFLLFRGELEVRRREPDGIESVVGRLFPGDCFGEAALLEGGPRNATVTACREAQVLVISKGTFEALLRSCLTFRRSVAAIAEARRAVQTEEAASRPEVVWIAGDLSVHADAMARLVNEAIRVEARESATLLLLHPDGRSFVEADGEVVTVAPSCATIPESHEKALHQVLATTHDAYVVCANIGNRWDPPDTFREEIDTAVYFTRHAARAIPMGLRPEVLLYHVEVTTRFVRADEPVRVGAQRIPLDVWGAWLPRSLDAMSREQRAGFGRLARTLTGRTVGVALGGGGAWGIAHCALLRALYDARIPVDMVSGTSFGCLVAAAYASLGLEGIERIQTLSGRLAYHLLIGTAHMGTTERFMRQHFFAHERVEDLSLPMLGVATEIDTGREVAFRRGRLVDVVLASGAMPGVFPTRDFEGKRYVDGAILNNVPVSALVDAGADFVIASNVVPPPHRMRAEPSLLRRALSLVPPVARARDSIRSLFMLAHIAGEQQSVGAAVSFTPDLGGFSSFDMGHGKEIMEAARAALPQVIRDTEERYLAFCRGASAWR